MAGQRRGLAPLLAIVLLVSACSGGNDPTPVGAPPAVTIETGVIELTPAVSATPPASYDAGAGAGPGITGSLKVLEPDAEVEALGMLRLYAAPEPTAATLDEYSAGAAFVIIATPDDLGVYPVEINGVRWYRVRAEDGLVGWVIADGIVEANAAE